MQGSISGRLHYSQKRFEVPLSWQGNSASYSILAISNSRSDLLESQNLIQDFLYELHLQDVERAFPSQILKLKNAAKDRMVIQHMFVRFDCEGEWDVP